MLCSPGKYSPAACRVHDSKGSKTNRVLKDGVLLCNGDTRRTEFLGEFTTHFIAEGQGYSHTLGV